MLFIIEDKKNVDGRNKKNPQKKLARVLRLFISVIH